MTSILRDSRRRTAALLAPMLLCGTAGAFAQAPTTPPGFVHVPETADTALSRNLVAIASNPKDAEALKGAGRAALELGDPQSALSFFARAEEVAPRDGRVKAGIASSMVMLEQGSSALKFFEDAVSLGVPEAEIAGDRGLAYDLSGNPRRAQKDYQISLRRKEDAEVRRRLALSLAISGDKDAAMSTIDTQLRTQDRAAWRTRAFILALAGDTAGATQAVQAVMPAQAAAMEPFLARLPSLGPADRALAVNFGHFPESGTAMAAASPQTMPPSPVSNVLANGRPDPAQPALGTRSPVVGPSAAAQQRPLGEQQQRSSSRNPVVDRQPAAPPKVEAAATQVASNRAPAPTRATASSPRDSLGNDFAQARGLNLRPSAVTQTRPAPAAVERPTFGPPAPAQLQASSAPAQVSSQAQQRPAPQASAPVTAPSPPVQQAPVLAAVDVPPSTSATDAPVSISGFADVAALVASLNANEAEPAPAARDDIVASAPARPQRKPVAASSQTKLASAATKPAGSEKDENAKSSSTKDSDPKGKLTKKADSTDKAEKAGKSAKDEDSKSARAAKKEPSRVWVQLAHGSSEGSLSPTLDRVKKKAPKLIGGRTTWTASGKGTSRLLVGPFKSAKEAEAFVDQLDKQDVKAVSWTSPAGQSVEKLSPR